MVGSWATLASYQKKVMKPMIPVDSGIRPQGTSFSYDKATTKIEELPTMIPLPLMYVVR